MYWIGFLIQMSLHCKIVDGEAQAGGAAHGAQAEQDFKPASILLLQMHLSIHIYSTLCISNSTALHCGNDKEVLTLKAVNRRQL